MNLLDFAQLTAFDACSMYGFRNGPDAKTYSCGHCWSKQDRIIMQNFLTLARERVEEFLDYPVYPRFVCEERHRWNRRGLIGPLKWGYVQKIGTKTTDDIDDLATDLTDTVFEFDYTPIGFTDTCEARIFHTVENGGEEIIPLSKSISGTTLTVQILKCALVDPNVVIPKDCLDYNNDLNFVETIMLKRVYAKPGTGSNLIWSPGTTSCASCSPCVEQTQTACPTIRDKRGSEIYVTPATYANDAWKGASFSAFSNCGVSPNYAELDYVAYYDEDCDEGCEQIPAAIKLAILHIALADMPGPPVCGCDIHNMLFKQDRELPRFWDDRSMNPFGVQLGHLLAYKMLLPFVIGGGGQLVAI